MNLLSRIFSLGRLGRQPKGQNAGRFLPPASVLIEWTQVALANDCATR